MKNKELKHIESHRNTMIEKDHNVIITTIINSTKGQKMKKLNMNIDHFKNMKKVKKLLLIKIRIGEKRVLILNQLLFNIIKMNSSITAINTIMIVEKEEVVEEVVVVVVEVEEVIVKVINDVMIILKENLKILNKNQKKKNK